MGKRMLFVGVLLHGAVLSVQSQGIDPCADKATIIVFRSFNIFDFKFSYRLFKDDSLLKRIKPHQVLWIETSASAITLHATTKAPSLNATKKSGYKKIKTTRYPFSLKPGGVYIVKCGFHNVDVFNYPRQPTIKLLKDKEVTRALKKRFLKRKIKRYLFAEKFVSN